MEFSTSGHDGAHENDPEMARVVSHFGSFWTILELVLHNGSLPEVENSKIKLSNRRITGRKRFLVGCLG